MNYESLKVGDIVALEIADEDGNTQQREFKVVEIHEDRSGNVIGVVFQEVTLFGDVDDDIQALKSADIDRGTGFGLYIEALGL